MKKVLAKYNISLVQFNRLPTPRNLTLNLLLNGLPPAVLRGRVQDDLEEWEQEAEHHPDVDHLEVGRPGEGGGGVQEQGGHHEHTCD